MFIKLFEQTSPGFFGGNPPGGGGPKDPFPVGAFEYVLRADVDDSQSFEQNKPSPGSLTSLGFMRDARHTWGWSTMAPANKMHQRSFLLELIGFFQTEL